MLYALGCIILAFILLGFWLLVVSALEDKIQEAQRHRLP
jgi:hypothetical protein